MKMGSRWTNQSVVALPLRSRGTNLITHQTGSGFEVESKVKTSSLVSLTVSAGPCSSNNHLLVAAGVGNLGWTDSDEGGSQLLHHTLSLRIKFSVQGLDLRPILGLH